MRLKQSFIVVTILLACASAVSAQIAVLPQKDTTLRGATDEKFRVGDVWEYQTREGEEKSTLTIVKVDLPPELGVIVHIAVDKVKLVTCHGGPSLEAVPHMPFTRHALEASVTKKIASGQPLPDYSVRYEGWKQDFSEKKAGVYVISVSKAVAVEEKTYRALIICN
jgi:hypothetical protein